jgi:hypothetical protein
MHIVINMVHLDAPERVIDKYEEREAVEMIREVMLRKDDVLKKELLNGYARSADVHIRRCVASDARAVMYLDDVSIFQLSNDPNVDVKKALYANPAVSYKLLDILRRNSL